MLSSLASLSLLLLSSSTLLVEAAGPHQARGLNHRRAASHAKRLPTLPIDVHGRQLPGTVKIRKRSDGSAKCKVRASSSSSSVLAASSTYPTSSAGGQQVQSSAVALLSSSSAASPTSTTAAWVAPTTTATAEWVAPTTTTTTTTAQAATTTTTASGSTSTITPSSGQFWSKAGVAGMDSLPWLNTKLGWWYDWNVTPVGDSGAATPVSMLWGAGTADATDAARLAAFQALSYVPSYLLGPNEPDCSAGGGSAGLSVADTAALWNTYIGPYKARGSMLGSPAMCHQAAETFLPGFKAAISVDWDFTTVHINKNSMDGVRADLDHYATYGKPLWVTEFACVDDSSSFIPCTDQTKINTYINEIVDLLEADSRVMAYAYSDGMGLGSVWPTVSNGALSASGQTYLAAISKYH
ncbi:glycosyl hydrolase catalytic core-domain-containing protein [Mrakia frigida]|uniref:glycosyl hydrolase catalytic core-domain-containing protein n=1 Tax=Mrakia frigida TaxID=29902 RepID=UPI003FCC0745